VGKDKVELTSAAVKEPVAVRFGWANYPVVNLWNKDGLPAHPFRTDNFPLTTQPKPAATAKPASAPSPSQQKAKLTYSVSGEVNQPGKFEIEDGEHVELKDALESAGGLKELADSRRIRVARTEFGRAVELEVNLTKRFRILPGDAITIRQRIF
jgi:protein involved in polysaccharide export with SLBB domain